MTATDGACAQQAVLGGTHLIGAGKGEAALIVVGWRERGGLSIGPTCLGIAARRKRRVGGRGLVAARGDRADACKGQEERGEAV